MGHDIELTTADGHRLSAYLAEPGGKPRGGIVVVQEIFGVTRHIRDVADQYAAAGYAAIAPALFDRVERGVDVAYTDLQKARGYVKDMNTDKVMLDLAAAVERVRAAGKVGVVGYCWGGLLSFLAAARLKIDAAIAYYGGGIHQHLAEKPRVPMMFHFGEKDSHIPLSAVEAIKAANPQGIFHLYPAEHGFNCTDRASFEPTCAKLAFERSVEFFHTQVG
ncbi:MAG TPA: dienelactone hydrolase family protein [Steroidobacteraceae bacterium]|jgi:carboxymethylenebutenolidase|nr:dienelactone hydrolase family protein [Steroidobacteraceae bacterium]